MKDGKFNYELVVVFSPKSEKKDKEDSLAKLVKTVEDLGAKCESQENLGLKDLVYAIQKHNRGDFWLLKLTADKGIKTGAVNLFLNREAEIIRYLILKV